MKDKRKRITFELDENVFYKFKSFCAEQRISVKDCLTNFIKEKIEN